MWLSSSRPKCAACGKVCNFCHKKNHFEVQCYAKKKHRPTGKAFTISPTSDLPTNSSINEEVNPGISIDDMCAR